MQVLDYESWKVDVLADIDASAHTTEKGDRFVQFILRGRYQLSEDDAVNATDVAGAGDRGVDAIYIEPADDGNPPRALTIQGKYGAAGEGFSPYQEFGKFAKALQQAIGGSAPTDALQQCASVIHNGGVIEYVVATVDPLGSNSQGQELEDVQLLAHQKFQERVVVGAVSLEDVYREIVDRADSGPLVELACKGVEVTPSVFVGAASLVDVYLMLHQYAQLHHGTVDSIYDRNVRKWLGKSAKAEGTFYEVGK